LDEIGEIPLDQQVKLLRFIEETKFVRVGGTAQVKVNVRIIAATHADLAALIAAGKFREDLLYRLGCVRIDLPPLRDRDEDIEQLAMQALDEFNAKHGKSVIGLTRAALVKLRRHVWPGNVRELHSVLERAVVLGNGRIVSSRDILIDERGGSAPLSPGVHGRLTGASAEAGSAPLENWGKEGGQDPPTEGSPQAEEGTPRGGSSRKGTRRPLRKTLLRTIKRCAGNLTLAARELGCHRRTLYRWLDKKRNT